MSGSASLSLEQAVLGHTLAFAPMTAPAQVFVALCMAAQAPAENVRGVEVSGLGYYRTTSAFALSVATPANMAANVAAVEFPMALAAWGVVGYFELWDAQTGGNRLYWGQLIDPGSGVPMTITVASGDIVRFSPAALNVQAASGVGGVSSSPWLPTGGGVMTGPITLAANATLPLHAVPLQQLNPTMQTALGYSLMQGLQPAGGFTSSPYPFGTMNTATALSCQMWPPLSGGRPTWPQVEGFWNASAVATYADRGFVSFYAGANSAAPTTVTVASASYTATTMFPSPALTAPQVSFIQQAIDINNQRASLIPPPYDNVGMMIDTQHTTKYTGNITAVAGDGTSVTVQGWYQMGNQAAGQVPPSGTGAYINPCTKMWNMNGVTTLDAASMCNQMSFLEGDVYNYQASYAGIGTIIPTIGISMNGNSVNTNGYAYIALGNWYTGFLSRGNPGFGYLIQPDATRNPPFGFVSQVRSDISGGHHPFGYFDSVSSLYRWSVTSSGGMNLGATTIENGLALATALTGNTPSITAVGVDTNVTMVLRGKGTGQVLVQSNLSVTGNAGFNGTAPIAKPTVTGAKGSNAALASLLTALAAMGLLTDTTTA